MARFARVTETLSHLPVMPVAEGVVRDVMAGHVTVLAAPTGSGKSMIVPSMIADASDEPVIVLMPRRFLAVDAASNVAQLADVALGDSVGYAVGKMAGDASRKAKHTPLVFMTYGYAIASGAINKAHTIVLDEVHERAEDISLARAILHARKKREPALRLLEMSATVDARKQAGYWSDVATTSIHNAAGAAMPCDERSEMPQDTKRTLEEATIDLITREGRKGIVVFRPGIKEIENTVETLKTFAAKAGIRNLEIASIYSGTPPDERRAAKQPPKPGHVKILVGTNVIESGVNLRWVDAGVSDGKGRIPYTREDTGAYALMLEDLPKWRILQQRGRVNRDPAATGFEQGIFLLHSDRGWDFRPEQATPEIARVALTGLAFRAACLGIDPTSLHFDAEVTPARLAEAKEALQRLQLIDASWNLTDDGRYAATLPVSPEAGALLCEARRLDAPLIAAHKKPLYLPDAIILAALLDGEGLRENYKKSHGRDNSSDILDAFKAYKELSASSSAKLAFAPEDYFDNASESLLKTVADARETMKARCAALNVSYNSLGEAYRMVAEISSRHHPRALAVDPAADITPAHYDALKQTLLNASVNSLFHKGPAAFQDLLRNYNNRRNNAGQPFSDYALSGSTAIDSTQAQAAHPIVAGSLREFPSKTGGASAPVIVNATVIPSDIVVRWAAGRSDAVFTDIEQHTQRNKGEKPSQSLDARYFGRAHFELPLANPTPELASQLRLLSTKERRSDARGM